MKHVELIVSSLVISLVAGAAVSAGQIAVMQESAPWVGDFDSNVLGYIDAYTTGGTLQDYYQYGAPYAASFNGPDPLLTSQRSHLFVVDGSDGSGLFAVHDKPEDGSGGQVLLELFIYGDADGFALIQNDDPGEFVDQPDPFEIRTTHNWIPCCTDGLLLGTLDGSWSIVMHFKEIPVGIDSWAAYGSDGIVIPLEIAVGHRVKLEAVSTPCIPAPGALLLGSLGMGLVGWMRKRRTL